MRPLATSELATTLVIMGVLPRRLARSQVSSSGVSSMAMSPPAASAKYEPPAYPSVSFRSTRGVQSAASPAATLGAPRKRRLLGSSRVAR